ncbi:DUF4125 family protein [Atopobium fossor]|uniref:DUF4125 family protein n=1 Tax=Atopobium fossor TaxID=39487 RepID=UPI00041414EF|nr:DUF4125 family protein [Atopobium fossor]
MTASDRHYAAQDRDNSCTDCCIGQHQINDYFTIPEVIALLDELGKTKAFRTALEKTVSLEWKQFDQVKHIDGRAACQDDARSFFVYRTAQYLAFPEVLLTSALHTLELAQQDGRNLIEEKYARMMYLSNPQEYKCTGRSVVQQPSPVKKQVLDEIYQILKQQLTFAGEILPVTHGHARPDTTLTNQISSLDYFIAELVPFRLSMLFDLVNTLADMACHKCNPIARTYIFAMRVMQAVEVVKQ